MDMNLYELIRGKFVMGNGVQTYTESSVILHSISQGFDQRSRQTGNIF